MVGSFLPSYQMEQKNKKPRVDAAPTTVPQTPPAVPILSADTHSSEQGQQSSAAQRGMTSGGAYGVDQSWASPAQQSMAELSRTPSSGDLKMTASGS